MVLVRESLDDGLFTGSWSETASDSAGLGRCSSSGRLPVAGADVGDIAGCSGGDGGKVDWAATPSV